MIARATREPSVSVHTLGAMVEIAQSFKHQGDEADAGIVAQAAMHVLLRNWWASVSGRPNVNPSLEYIASKLYSRGAIDRQTLRLLANMTAPTGRPPYAAESLMICRILLDLIRGTERP